LTLGVLAIWVGPAAGQEQAGLAATAHELDRWALMLADENGSAREEAIEGFLTLNEDSIPEVRRRTVRFPELDATEAYRAVTAFRHKVGSLRADENVDIVPGVGPRLAEDRSPMTVAMAERLLLLRAMERIGTPEAGQAIADLIGRDYNAFRWECRRIVQRMGPKALPILLGVRGHGSRGVRRWVRWGIEELGLEEPGHAVQQEDARLLADILRAYGEARDMNAMTVVASFTTHDRRQVRSAARWAMERFGRNAIWQLRRVYRNVTLEAADGSWGWRETMEALYEFDDEKRRAPVREDLQAGFLALESGDLASMRTHFDRVLRRAPDLPTRSEMAPGYGALGQKLSSEDRIGDAERAFRRAMLLAPEHVEAPRWEAELAFIEAQRNLAAGIVDLTSYRKAVALNPEHVQAQSSLALFEKIGRKRVPERRTWPATLGAIFLTLLSLLFFVKLGLGRARAAPPEQPMEADTLPG